jgi:class 3 adenylate cyclase/tetratricopeptide (TPR) repeat protein
VAACSSCGKELPAGEFPFCPFCTAPLTEATASAVEERKVVSVLFCDLVGFTAASEQADPEDIRSRIRPYHARLRQSIEGYGGTVEKFIGDAVMAVFGAPVGHEDDAERAVRAGLRILEVIAELNESEPGLELQVRVGIDTGEAVVALGARPELGEGIVTGDVVNTASRLQGAAPVNGIAVSEQTYRATERIFDYEELPAVEVKGKTHPLGLYRPLAPRARFGSDVTRTHTTPLVGRELEKLLLIGIFERAAQQRSCQLVTIVGEPGVGKSRLCEELFQRLYDRPELTRWRQGRCLPYGDGIAFWPLGEIVKAECGILETDSPHEAEAKLERALPEDPDRVWLKARLAPLVGASGEPASQEESFTAWRRCLEAWAEARETILVFEDLHWADDALLSFLEHLADWAEGVPLLLLCTARPELYERHPSWATGLRNATTVNLGPLTDDETARLLSLLLERAAVLPAETQQALLERAGGNPLFAEEFVRLLSDRGQVSAAEEVPDSVQALIAARLDTLSAERKSLLQDAAVLGKIFWAGAVAQMGGREPHEVDQALHELARKELVRPVRASSMEGEAEYGFWHLLVRDVCYAQIPRAGRAARHRAAAAWIEEKAGSRAEDLADVLAHHYLQALELTRATGQADRVEELEAGAVRYLALAGARALTLDVDRAEQNLAKALELAAAGHPERATVLERWAQAAQQQGRLKEAKEALEQALALRRERDEPVAVGRVLVTLGTVLQRLGARQDDVIAEALALLEAQPPGPELVAAYARLAGAHFIRAAYVESIAAAEQAIDLAARLDLAEQAGALGARGYSRALLGDRKGLEDMRRALELAVQEGESRGAAVLHNNGALVVWLYEGPQAALERCREGVNFCERRGITEFAHSMAAQNLTFLAELGRAAEALEAAEPLAARGEGAGDVSILVEAWSVQLRLVAERDEHDRARPGAEKLTASARESGQSALIADAFTSAAKLLLVQGQRRQAQTLLTELEQIPETRADLYYIALLPEIVRTALALGDRDLAGRLVDGVVSVTPLSEHALVAARALLAEAAGEQTEAAALYAEAAERWREFGNVPERAYALLGQGRCLLAVGKARGEQPLTEARDLFQSMGYRPVAAEIEALVADAAALSA